MNRSNPSTTLFDQKLRNDIIKTAIVSTLTGLIGYLITSKITINSDLKTAIVGFSVFLGYLIISFIQRKVSKISEEVGKKYIEDRTGIVNVFKNLEDCQEDMKTDFKNSHNVRMLLQIGRREFGDGKPSYFLEDAKTKSGPEDRVRVLRAASSSPFLSVKRAQFRSGSVERWQEDIRRLQTELALVKKLGAHIIDREHHEPYLWRIFLFDDIAYVSGYLHNRGNDRMAVVYRLKKGGNSLFAIYDRYFEYLWKKYDPEAQNVPPDDVWANWV